MPTGYTYPTLPAALHYAALGLAVLPLHTPTRTGCSCARDDCDRPGKHPRYHSRLFTGGVHQASTDPDTICRWWTLWPDKNIGIRTGDLLDVCDIDTDAGRRELLALLGADPVTYPTVRTGSGGWHLYLAATGHGNRVNLLPGVDWRGHGGYIVAPPSLHACGHHYLWHQPLALPPPVCPASLLNLLAPPPPSPAERTPVRDPTRYAAAALTGEVDRILSAPAPRRHGHDRTAGGRNHALNTAAYNLGRLVAGGALDEHRVIEALTDAALRARLGRAETARTIHSGLQAGKQHPCQPDTRR